MRLSADFNIQTGAIHFGELGAAPAQPLAAIQPGPIDDIVAPLIRYYDPTAIEVDQLMLTSQGTWANLRGAWDDPVNLPDLVRARKDLTVQEWRHRSTQGRDHYVRVVYLGFGYPIRHRMSLIKVTERKFQTIPGTNDIAAYLRQRMYLVPRELVKEYADALYADRKQGREMPIKRLRLLTSVTPNIDAPQYIPGAQGAFWIRVGGNPFPFEMLGHDLESSPVNMTGGLIFVPISLINDANALEAVRQEYAKSASKALRKISVPYQRVHYAQRFKKPDNSSYEGNSALETSALYFTTHALSGSLNNPANVPPFAPYLHETVAAEVRIPAADQLAKGQGDHEIRLFARYLDRLQNDATVFAELVKKKAVEFAAEQAGGLTTPNVNMSGISQHLGPVAGTLNQLASGTFDPLDFFNGVSAKLLGGIDLFEIISSLTAGVAGPDGFANQFPKMLSLPEPAPPQTPQRIKTAFKWEPKVRQFLPFEPTDDTRLTVNVELVQHLDNPASPPSASIIGEITAFYINFLEIIRIRFDELRFTKKDNQKLDVHVVIPDGGIEFGGPLKFLNELEKYLDPGQFVDPPSLSVSSSGVVVGYSLELPPLAVGIFTLKNVALGAALTIPFGTDTARVRFNLSERHNPFQLAVMIFAGGGFFAITLGAHGMEVLEIALEFGGSLSLDIGVASGGVSVMAGIYFKLENKVESGVKIFSIQLTAYIRLNGHLSVLGLVSISIEFYLELTYKEVEKDGVSKSKLTGRATVTVEVEVLFFSISVSMTVERTLSGSADDPTFTDMLTPGDWFEYGEAFA